MSFFLWIFLFLSKGCSKTGGFYGLCLLLSLWLFWFCIWNCVCCLFLPLCSLSLWLNECLLAFSPFGMVLLVILLRDWWGFFTWECGVFTQSVLLNVCKYAEGTIGVFFFLGMFELWEVHSNKQKSPIHILWCCVKLSFWRTWWISHVWFLECAVFRLGMDVVSNVSFLWRLNLSSLDDVNSLHEFFHVLLFLPVSAWVLRDVF